MRISEIKKAIDKELCEKYQFLLGEVGGKVLMTRGGWKEGKLKAAIDISFEYEPTAEEKQWQLSSPEIE